MKNALAVAKRLRLDDPGSAGDSMAGNEDALPLTPERKLEILDLYNRALTAQAITKTRDDEEAYRKIGGFPELPTALESTGTKEAEVARYEVKQRRYQRAIFWPRLERKKHR